MKIKKIRINVSLKKSRILLRDAYLLNKNNNDKSNDKLMIITTRIL